MEQLDMFVKERSEVEVDNWGTSRDPDTPDRKRKPSDDRQPESPPEIERKHAPNNWHREKQYRNHPDAMDTDSPASFPKHLPSADAGRYHQAGYQDMQVVDGKVGTPVLATDEGRGMHAGYDAPAYRGDNYPASGTSNSYYDNGHYQGHTPPRSHGHYLPEMETSPHYSAAAGTPNSQQDVFMRPRRWACDYCHVATFVSYEEACAHEEVCARQYHERFGRPPHPSRGPVPQYDRGQQERGHVQPGAMYQPRQDAGRPPTWGSRGSGPPMPPLGPHSYEGYYHQQHHQQGHYSPHHMSPHHQQHHGYPPARYGGYPGYDARVAGGHQRRDIYDNGNGKRMLLAMPTDSDSLSDRQCYVRSEMVEIFAATDKDVSARHSKGAQKLVDGQVGIRCVHCSHLRPRDRAERAVCYPSSISRIYQTVADMQRFHFEQCREIPMEIRKIYKSLKTTRPRGVGSPQTYWIQSANLLDLVDSKEGIRFGADLAKEEEQLQQQQLQEDQDHEQPQEHRSPTPSDVEPVEFKVDDAELLHQTPERSEHHSADPQEPKVPEVTA